jgi:NAD(P)-dependent dehydrogenase (short-subunit alcohol dehydrogenase family)
VTGANSGFGLATALRLASHGWETYGTVRSDEKAETLRQAAEHAGVAERVHPIVLDVSDHDAITARFPELPDFYAVVNNAGYSQLGAIEEVSAKEAKAQLDVNLIAPAIVSSCALPGMRRLGEGRIVMVSSVAGLASVMPLNGWYHASKFGLEALSDVLRMEVAGFGVKISIVEPGFFNTGILDHARREAEGRGSNGSLYASAYERARQLVSTITQVAPPVDLVARRIVGAIESRAPARRYLVGLDARASVLANTWVPRGIIDLTARYLTRLDTVRSERSAEA